MKKYVVYILECSDKSYYIGLTNTLERRVMEHADGISQKCYTFNRRPVTLVFFNEFEEQEQALAFEKRIKGWQKTKQQALITGDYKKLIELSKPAKRRGTKRWR